MQEAYCGARTPFLADRNSAVWGVAAAVIVKAPRTALFEPDCITEVSILICKRFVCRNKVVASDYNGEHLRRSQYVQASK